MADDLRLVYGGLVGIVRFTDPAVALTAALGLADAGVVPEVTLTTPDAFEVLCQVSKASPIVLAGSVRTATEVERCAGLGVHGIVSPCLETAVVEAAIAAGLEVWPGVLTPTELAHAEDFGVTGVKVFPARLSGGPDYVRMLRGPFPSVQIMATGGVSVPAVAEYMCAGCVAVGVGDALIDRVAAEAGDREGVMRTAVRHKTTIGERVAELRKETGQWSSSALRSRRSPGPATRSR